jgi:hypothetical protein
MNQLLGHKALKGRKGCNKVSDLAINIKVSNAVFHAFTFSFCINWHVEKLNDLIRRTKLPIEI